MIDSVPDLGLFGRVVLVAMLDRVDNSLFQRKPDSENVFRRIALAGHCANQCLDEWSDLGGG
ncbi:MAG TPA: hypothetical protein VG013_17545 [Gemmataceae bacterium]|nr:hypothetical protein [Gemmataceae bacterium]